MSRTTEMFVLLVGVNQFMKKPDLKDLQGCVNDARAMHEVFKKRYRVPDENIRMLTDAAATRDAIINTFREHLIGNAAKWSQRGDGIPSPAFVYFFAGHGSTCRTPVPHVFDESTIAHDSRAGECWDIRDWELGALVDELASYTDNVTLILDCCKAGSGTRDTEEFGSARYAEPDMREPQNTRSAPSEFEAGLGSTQFGTLLPRNGAAGKHVVLSACRNDQVAKEHGIDPDNPELKQGAFTFFLARELMNLPSGAGITYRQLQERVGAEVHSRYAMQVPQCEGDRDRLLFQLERPPIDPLFMVRSVDGEVVNVDCGLVHGLTKGSELTLYSRDTLKVDDDTPKVGSLLVESVRSLDCTCRLQDANDSCQPLAKVAIERINYGDSRRHVAIAIADDALRAKVEACLTESGLAESLQLVNVDQVPFFVVKEIRGHFDIYDASGKRLVAPVPIAETQKLGANLMSLTRYFNALHIRNRDARSRLHGRVSIEIFAIDESVPIPEGKSRRPETAMRALPTTCEGLPIVEAGTQLAFKVTNHSDEPIYCDVVSFSYNYAVTPVCYALSGLLPGTNRKIGSLKGATDRTTRHYEWIGDHIDDEIVFNPVDDSFVEGREFLKVIATRDKAADLSVLMQSELDAPDAWEEPDTSRHSDPSSLEELLLQTMKACNTRLSVSKKTANDDWAEATIEFVVRKA